MTAEGVKVRFEALDIADNALRILGSKMGSVRCRSTSRFWPTGTCRAVEARRVDLRRYPLEGINAAIGRLRAAKRCAT